jgi:hypothetical protein
VLHLCLLVQPVHLGHKLLVLCHKRPKVEVVVRGPCFVLDDALGQKFPPLLEPEDLRTIVLQTFFVRLNLCALQRAVGVMAGRLRHMLHAVPGADIGSPPRECKACISCPSASSMRGF